jgi:hypothetical protein
MKTVNCASQVPQMQMATDVFAVLTVIWSFRQTGQAKPATGSSSVIWDRAYTVQ